MTLTPTPNERSLCKRTPHLEALAPLLPAWRHAHVSCTGREGARAQCDGIAQPVDASGTSGTPAWPVHHLRAPMLALQSQTWWHKCKHGNHAQKVVYSASIVRLLPVCAWSEALGKGAEVHAPEPHAHTL